MVPSQTGSQQAGFLDQLKSYLKADRRICAAWLEGSLGRGDADRYSDVDLHLLVDASAADQFRTNAQEWLSSLQPLVLFNWLFGDSMINGLSVQTAALSHLRLARIMQEHGPSVAARQGFSYPVELEDAVIAYVAAELKHLGLADCVTDARIVSFPSFR
jgi:predicted nucleotidyltransferase